MSELPINQIIQGDCLDVMKDWPDGCVDAIPACDVTIHQCSRGYVRDFVEKHHYSHNINGIKTSWCFRVMWEKALVGAVMFGQMSTTAWKKFADAEYKVVELRRLVLLDRVGKNAESRVVGHCLRWIKKHTIDIEVVVSYADPNHGHTGTIYRASNFQYIGVSASDVGYRDIETGQIYHSRALRTKYKGEYKPFVKRLREKLEQGGLEKIKLQGKHCFVYKIGARKRLEAVDTGVPVKERDNGQIPLFGAK